MSWEVLETLRREREARVLEIIRMSLHAETIMPEMNLRDDLGMDSLDEVGLVVWLEEEFNIEITDDEIAKCMTVRDVQELVNRRVEYQETEGRR